MCKVNKLSRFAKVMEMCVSRRVNCAAFRSRKRAAQEAQASRRCLRRQTVAKQTSPLLLRTSVDKKRGILVAAIFVTFFLLAGCGGGSDTVEYSLRANYPNKLAPYSNYLSARAMIIGKDSAVLSSESNGHWDGGVWRFAVEPLGETSGASLKVGLIYSQQGGEEKGTSDLDEELTVAYVSVPLSSFEGGDPFDPGEGDYDLSVDNDSDGLANLDEMIAGVDPNVSDTDGDGVPDGTDAFPSISAEWLDTDRDGIGDNVDTDIDGDGLSNDQEKIIGTSIFLADTDGDGALDGSDVCPLVSDSSQSDADGDGRGDTCDDDSDGDGLSDSEEAGRGTNRLVADTDGDGLGDGAEVKAGSNPLVFDTDSDGIKDGSDNCPISSNASQSDVDRDSVGDVCDSDRDSDGVANSSDNCPDASNIYQDNVDGDSAGDACDVDIDADGIPNASDNCPYVANSTQLTTDSDTDGVRVDCDLDDTDAGVLDESKGIFVDVAHGSDTARGTRSQPLASVVAGVAKAATSGLGIYVAAGTYNVSTLVLASGAKVFGGFANGDQKSQRFAMRDVRSSDSKYRTLLTRSDVPTTVILSASGIHVDGFHVENTATKFDAVNPSVTIDITSGSAAIERNTIKGNTASLRSVGLRVRGGTVSLSRNRIEGSGYDALGSVSTGLSIEGGTVTATNNIVIAGSGRFANGVIIEDISPLIVNNTVDARSGNSSLGQTNGILVENSSPTFINNVVFTGNAPDQYAITCNGTGPSISAAFRNNLLARFPAETGAAIVMDCDGMGYQNASFSLGKAVIDSNDIFSGASLNLMVDSSYRPVGSGGAADALDDGMDASTTALGNVTVDFNGTKRPQGAAHDVGAVEK